MGNIKYNTEEERLEATRASKRKYQARYRQNFPDHKKNWGRANKEKVKDYNRVYSDKRRRENPLYKFSSNLRNLIKDSFKRIGLKKNSRTETLLGCTISEFKDYILSKAPEGVTLENFNMREYHIDHIIPLSSAKTEEEMMKLCHYTNLQPMWCTDNIKKSNKV